MKRSSQLISLAAALVLAASFSNLRAEDAGKKASDAAKALEKYDANHDGKLDEQEKAAMKADKDAAKAAKEAERRAKALTKYDANHNGTLDADEEAKWKADEAAAKEKRKAHEGEKAKEHGHGDAEGHSSDKH